MNITEKVSYIKGLAEGMKLDFSTDEGKILKAIIDVLGDIGLEIEEINEDLDDMADVVGDIEESVCDLEDEVFADDDDDDDDDFEEEMYEITCPNCDNTITVDFDVLSAGSLNCPNCGESLEFDLSEIDDEECDCGCNHNHN